MFKTQEELFASVCQMMEAAGWQKEWVNLSTAGMILVAWRKGAYTFTQSFESMEQNGVPLPDVSDLYVD